MAAVLYWRLPELTRIDPGPLRWLPGIPSTLHAHPVWGDYLAKRSQLVADLATQVQHHARRGDDDPVWAPPETHLSTALVGEIAVWRAANRHQSQDSRPTGGAGQLQTAPALWKQRLDRLSRVPPTRQQMRLPASDRQDAPPLVAATPTGGARTNSSNGVRAGRPRRADGTGHSRHIAAPGT
jgi:hypothetical protein